MRTLIVLICMLAAPLAAAEYANITDNGNFVSVTCPKGTGRWAAYDDGSGYDSGTLTFQYRHQSGTWENACPTTTDCQITTGDSGVKTFDLGAASQVRINAASIATASAGVDVEIVCN